MAKTREEIQQIKVVPAPTGGKGLALTVRGLLPWNRYGSGNAPKGTVLTSNGDGTASFQ